MRLRIMIVTFAVLLVATGVVAILGVGQAQGAWDVASYTWSD